MSSKLENQLMLPCVILGFFMDLLIILAPICGWSNAIKWVYELNPMWILLYSNIAFLWTVSATFEHQDIEKEREWQDVFRAP